MSNFNNIIINDEESKKMLVRFHFKDQVGEIAVEDALTENQEMNNLIVSGIVQSLRKTFENNAAITMNNFSCTGSQVSRIEICDEEGHIIGSINNDYFEGGI